MHPINASKDFNLNCSKRQTIESCVAHRPKIICVAPRSQHFNKPKGSFPRIDHCKLWAVQEEHEKKHCCDTSCA